MCTQSLLPLEKLIDGEANLEGLGLSYGKESRPELQAMPLPLFDLCRANALVVNDKRMPYSQ